MSIIQAIILGVVQGITEFLPVSSSGHLQLFKELLDVHIVDNLTFDVALHAGTVCSTLLVLWRDIWRIIRGFFAWPFNSAHAYIFKIAISMLPIAIVGFTCKDYLDAALSSDYRMLLVGGSLLLTSGLLWFASSAKVNPERSKIGYKDAFLIGVAQAVAVLPGVSRSGSTIGAGLILGKRKGDVAKFSFLMVLVPILGSMLMDFIDGGGKLVVEGVSSEAMLAGFFSSFVVGAVACRGMIEFVKRGKLWYFAIYCAIVGVVALGSYFI